ncbi:MAG: hypothetical protein WCO60_09340 [Verrucomicrobiota bacterium]
MKRFLLPIAFLVGFGILKLPVEKLLLSQEQAAGFQAAQLNLHVRSQLGQMGFVAALSGFRAVMADLLFIRVGTAFQKTEWGRMKLLLESATQLQPKAVMFWEMAHFHMAYDAAIASRENRIQQPSETLRRRAEREYMHIGEQFLLDGISFNPDNSRLYEHLGRFYSKRLYDHERAAEAYATSAKKPGAHEYVGRFAAYELAEVPGKEAQAYQQLCHFYKTGPRVPTLENLIHRLEEKLAVPPSERVYSPSNQETVSPAQAR